MEKFVTKKKMSKKVQKKINSIDRNTWGMVKPATQVFKSKKHTIEKIKVGNVIFKGGILK